LKEFEFNHTSAKPFAELIIQELWEQLPITPFLFSCHPAVAAAALFFIRVIQLLTPSLY